MAAFNEAGAIEPRKPGHEVVCAGGDAYAFNEAGAIEPRKPRRARPSRVPARAFNEAGAIEPRKLGQANEMRRHPEPSMRPGQ